MKECRVFKVRAFNNSVNWASFLAESAEDALGHVDVVLGRATRAIRPWLRLNRDGESGARGLAQLASNASLFTGWVPAQSVLASEHGGERTLLPRVMEHMIGLEGRVNSEPDNWPNQFSVEELGVQALSHISAVNLIWQLVTN